MPDTAVPHPVTRLIPVHEAQRLQALEAYAILDTEPEPEFDALARLAAHTFNTPAALVGLMDSERLWLKAQLGLDAAQFDRDLAWCAHTIVQPGHPLVVPDLRQDGRFDQHPLVQGGPQWRFYAGAPVLSPQGLAVGTLAVLDSQPRTFTTAQRAALLDLSTLVSAALEGRRHGLALKRLAVSDHLTGLANRSLFERTLQVELAHAMRTGESFTVLCMDLDGFKAINDGFGHAAGDEVLCLVSQRLMQQVRLGDVLARFGGDEFGIVMRHGATESAQVLAKRIVKAVSAPITLSSGDVIGVGISIGMAAYSDDVVSVPALLAQADQALYQAKKQNERRWKMFVGIR